MLSFIQSQVNEVAEFLLDEEHHPFEPGEFLCWYEGGFSVDSEDYAPLLGVVLTERRCDLPSGKRRYLLVATDAILATTNYDSDMDVTATNFYVEEGMLTDRCGKNSTPIAIEILEAPTVGNPYLLLRYRRLESFLPVLAEFARLEGEPDDN